MQSPTEKKESEKAPVTTTGFLLQPLKTGETESGQRLIE
jgi:hypothetical protein